MASWLKLCLAVFIGLVACNFQVTSAKANSSAPHDDNDDDDDDDDDDDEKHKWTRKNLTIAWIYKPPYVRGPDNSSLDNKARGIIRDAMLRYILWDCSGAFKLEYEITTLRTDSESGLIQMLKQNKAHMAIPIFERQNDQKYSEFIFFKLGDHPGTEYITLADDENDALDVVFDSVLRSWPLLAVTMIFTAIAGITMWALDTYWNSEEFPRSFIRGSWDGFWWSFISMTTVGYGDKAPKSAMARIFSVIWILFGLIAMAIFMANVTTALTALSLQNEPTSLHGVQVGVIRNGTEYQHALEEHAQTKIYNNIDAAVDALKSKEVKGILLDRYTASYYQIRDKLKTLLAVKKFEFQRDVGALFHQDRQDLAHCLQNYHRSAIWESMQTLTSSYELEHQTTAKSFNLFDDSSPFVKYLMYISLGVLVVMLIIGLAWDILVRKKGRGKKNNVLAVAMADDNEGMTTKGDAIRADLETTRVLLRQALEQFDQIESKVSKLKLI